ncbi:MAG: hypothetical protein ACI92E_001282 [Oceanicoccus sp.]|jgi:hypothetical protein
MSEISEEVARLNLETSKIQWSELQKFFAQGLVIAVKPGIDLIEVATAFSKDNKAEVEVWLETESVFPVKDEHAVQWLDHDPLFWAVVVAPWVLIQKV